MDEKKLISPFVILDNNVTKEESPPDEAVKKKSDKWYIILLVKIYPDEDDTKDWAIVLGRDNARKYCIDNIDTIDPLQSVVAVEGGTISFDNLPSVYELFVNSSWGDPNIYSDGFNIKDHVQYSFTDSDEIAMSEGSKSMSESSEYVENKIMHPSDDGIDL